MSVCACLDDDTEKGKCVIFGEERHTYEHELFSRHLVFDIASERGGRFLCTTLGKFPGAPSLTSAQTARGMDTRSRR